MELSVRIYQPTGLLDGTKAQEFRENIKELMEQGAKIILLDFSEVTFMDSSGLGAVVLALKTVRSVGGQLYICSVNEQIKMLFELTSMDKVFEIFADRQEFEDKIMD